MSALCYSVSTAIQKCTLGQIKFQMSKLFTLKNEKYILYRVTMLEVKSSVLNILYNELTGF